MRVCALPHDHATGDSAAGSGATEGDRRGERRPVEGRRGEERNILSGSAVAVRAHPGRNSSYRVFQEYVTLSIRVTCNQISGV